MSRSLHTVDDIPPESYLISQQIVAALIRDLPPIPDPYDFVDDFVDHVVTPQKFRSDISKCRKRLRLSPLAKTSFPDLSNIALIENLELRSNKKIRLFSNEELEVISGDDDRSINQKGKETNFSANESDVNQGVNSDTRLKKIFEDLWSEFGLDMDHGSKVLPRDDEIQIQANANKDVVNAVSDGSINPVLNIDAESSSKIRYDPGDRKKKTFNAELDKIFSDVWAEFDLNENVTSRPVIDLNSNETHRNVQCIGECDDTSEINRLFLSAKTFTSESPVTGDEEFKSE